MKRILSVLLIIVCLVSLTACQASGQDKNSARFVGKVLEKYETGCLVEVIDKGNNTFSVGDLISVNTNIATCPDYAVNDLLTITFDGTVVTDPKTDIDAVRRKMGMVFQHFNLFPNMTIRRNITLAPVRTGHMTKEEANDRATQLLQMDSLRKATQLNRVSKAPDCHEGRPGFAVTDGEPEILTLEPSGV